MPAAPIHAAASPAASISIAYEPVATPKLIAALSGSKVLRVAVGHNHCLAVDESGSCYTWGNGGYGRLGHKVGTRGSAVLRCAALRWPPLKPLDVRGTGAGHAFAPVSM